MDKTNDEDTTQDFTALLNAKLDGVVEDWKDEPEAALIESWCRHTKEFMQEMHNIGKIRASPLVLAVLDEYVTAAIRTGRRFDAIMELKQMVD